MRPESVILVLVPPASDFGGRRASCGAGQVYCWFSCMDAPETCAADHEIQCAQPSTGLTWPDDLGAQSHCYDCEPTCVATATPSAGRAGGSTNPFCNDKIAPVSMYMDGFLGWSDPDAPCVAFLHRDAILTSPGLLFAAFFCTVFVGVGVEGLAAARRWRARTLDHVFEDAVATGGNSDRGGRGVARADTHPVRRAGVGGYILMLISMTYHSVLFTGVVAGLVIGHAAFNASAPPSGGGASACCQHVGTVPERVDETDEQEEERTGRETEAKVTLVGGGAGRGRVNEGGKKRARGWNTRPARENGAARSTFEATRARVASTPRM